MGMDIFLVEYQGKDKNGYLKTKSVGEKYDWDSTRYTVRHRFAKEVEQFEVSSGIYGDWESICRPTDFEAAFGWAETLNEDEQKYIKKILTILQSNDKLYLEYSY